MDDNNSLALVFKRNSFYRRQYFLTLGAFGLSLVVIGVLIGVLVFLKRNPTHPLYFATDAVGRLIQVIPVDQPNMKEADVIAWATEAVEMTYSYDYVNYHYQFQAAQKYFTNYGWSKYIAALIASNNLVALTERKMISIAHIVDKPKILAQGLLAGAYAWKFEMPMLVSYMEPPYDKIKFSNAYTVTLIVQRQPILQSYKGLGIVQIIVSSAASESNQPQELSNTPSG